MLSLGVQWALHKLTRCQHSPGSDVGLASTRRSGRALSTWLPQRSLGATMVPLQAPEALVPCSTQWHVGTLATAVVTAASLRLSCGQMDRQTDQWQSRGGPNHGRWPAGEEPRHWRGPGAPAGHTLGLCCSASWCPVQAGGYSGGLSAFLCVGARWHLSWTQTPRLSEC